MASKILDLVKVQKVVLFETVFYSFGQMHVGYEYRL